MSPVYASPRANCQNAQLEYIQEIGKFIYIPWLLFVDVNQVLKESDKLGGQKHH